jgi:hypothetical protein
VVSQLEYRYAAKVEDIIISPLANEPYTTLRSELVRRLSSSRDQRVRQLLTHEEMVDRKLPQFLRHPTSLAPDVPDDFLRSIWSSRLPPHIQTILGGQAASQLADRIAEFAPLPTTAAIAQAPDRAGLLQKIEDLSRQVAALISGRTRQRFHSKDRRNANDVLPQPAAPRSADTVGTTGNSGTRHEGVLQRAPSASRKTATGVNGGRLLFHTLRPPIRHRTRHNKATRSFTTSHINNRSRATHGASRTMDCTVRTHSPAATPDLSAPLRTTGCPRADSLAHSLSGSSRFSVQQDVRCELTRPQPRRTSAQRRTTSCPERIACSFTGSLCASSPSDYPGTLTPVAGRQQHTVPDNLAARIQHDSRTATA